jgi:restriction endonuclease S subunit
MEEAERIARDEHGSEKITVISGKQTLLYRGGDPLKYPPFLLDNVVELKLKCVWGGGEGGGILMKLVEHIFLKFRSITLNSFFHDCSS